MFDFEKLEVYAHVRQLVARILAFIDEQDGLDDELSTKLKEAAMRMLLLLAEGTGRMVQKDKLHFYTTARSAVFESVAILHIMLDTNQVQETDYEDLYEELETASKMLLGMIRSFS